MVWMILFDFFVFIMFLFRSFTLPANTTGTESPYDTIHGMIKYYLLLGFFSIFFYWVAWSSWVMAAERQVRRIRCVIIHIVK
jgi:hypothetical protein